MLNRMMTTCLKDIEKTYKIGLNISIGMSNGITDTSLSGKIYDDFRLIPTK